MANIPYNETMEQAVLIAALADPMIFPKLEEILEPSDFYRKEHQEIFTVIRSLQGKADSLTVQERLAEGTKEYFERLVQESDRILPSVANALVYAENVKGKAKIRASITLGQSIISLSYVENADPDMVMQQIEDNFAAFIKQRVIEDRSESSVEAYRNFAGNLTHRVKDNETGITTGIYQVDLILHKLEGLVVLAARPSVGKTAFAINIARNVVKTAPVVFFSLEQTKDQIFERMLAAEAQVPLEYIRTGAYLADPNMVADIEKANAALETVLEYVHIDDRPNIPTNYVTSVCRQKQFEWGKIGLIVVDYLHLMRLNNKNTVDALGDACKELRALGKELECPVLLLSQLSRGPQADGGRYSNRRPQLVDLRSSGEIEQSADIVIFLHRESYGEEAGLAPDMDDICEAIIRKHRNGRQGTVEMKWIPRYMVFRDL